MNRFNKFLKRIVTSSTAIGFVFLLILILIVIINIITRQFGLGILGTYEAVQLSISIMIGFAIAYAAICEMHVKVDILITRLSKRVQRVLYIITSLLTLSICTLMAYYGVKFALDQFSNKEGTIVMDWPIYPFRLIFIIGIIIMCFVLILEIIQKIRDGKK